YIESCNRYFYCDLTCYVGHSVQVHEMAPMVKALRVMDFKNVVYANEVFHYRVNDASGQAFELPALSSILSLLKTAPKEKVIEVVENLLDELVFNQEIDADTLHRFNQDFVQVLYSFLHARGIQVHQLFGDEDSMRISDQAGRSITNMKIWVRHAIHRATNQADAFKETGSIVEKIKRFIAMNIDQDLSREIIAEQVYMNPSYLSKFFKKETGYSLSDYVLVERIKQAKELLTQTNVSISTIAASVGYTHFSHFSKIFKKYAGICPTEYRSQFGKS
ncbi:helix-turn-helix domain-containing protein, partial [Paenibacillus sp. MCAF20]